MCAYYGHHPSVCLSLSHFFFCCLPVSLPSADRPQRDNHRFTGDNNADPGLISDELHNILDGITQMEEILCSLALLPHVGQQGRPVQGMRDRHHVLAGHCQSVHDTPPGPVSLRIWISSSSGSLTLGTQLLTRTFAFVRIKSSASCTPSDSITLSTTTLSFAPRPPLLTSTSPTMCLF
jgi:hypothetical protein